MPRRLFAAAAFALTLAATASADPVAEEVRTRVRAAVGYDAFCKLEHGVVLTGKAESFGLPGTFTLRLHPDGRYLRVVESPTGEATGYDGKARWARQFANPALPADLDEARMLALHHAILGHRWLAPDGGYAAVIDPAEHRAYRPCVLVRHPDAPGFAARVYVDPATWLPSQYTVVAAGRGESVVELADYRDVGGAKVAGKIGIGRFSGGAEFAAAAATAAPAPAGADPFAPPPPPDDTRFDPAGPAAVEAKMAKGLMFVRPAVNGKPGPWFQLSGVSTTSGLGAADADRLGLGRLGGTGPGQVEGQGPARPVVRLRPADRFALGPAAVAGLVMVEYPTDGMTAMSRFVEFDVGGQVGGDVLSRVVLAADWAAGTVSVHDPRTYQPPPGLTWEPVRFSGGAPFVAGTFEGKHAGPFAFDTGGDGPLTFGPGAVRGLNLLAGRPVDPFGLSNPGGATLAYKAAGGAFQVFGRPARVTETRFIVGDYAADKYPYALGSFSPAT
ncbi:MAG TPA: hypothetical protein VH092_33780, partial [Urbifossiella sp.]|nr:hypothetical protein [Urbifossiella sp.]